MNFLLRNPLGFSGVVAAMAGYLLLSTTAAAQTASIATEPAAPTAYSPFVARVTFLNSYCISGTYPLVGEATFLANTLTMTFSQLKPGPCGRTHTVTIPGLPAGDHTLRLSMTTSTMSFTSVTTVAETIERQISVGDYPGHKGRFVFRTARISPTNIGNIFNTPEGGTGPIALFASIDDILFSIQTLEVGTAVSEGDAAAKTFEADYHVGTAESVPPELTPLYQIYYPLPLAGIYHTVNRAVAANLAKAWVHPWQQRFDDAYAEGTLVGRIIGGTCPIGMTPVYQAFHPTNEIAHRYTQDATTYRLLIQNGYVGEGAAWCARAR